MRSRSATVSADPADAAGPLDVEHPWGIGHRDSENEPFFEAAFDFVASRFGCAPRLVVDAGCGPGRHAERLARRGFRVLGMDLSFSAARQAALRLAANGVRPVAIAAGDVGAVPLRDASVQGVLCWGVLMHVPDLSRSLEELARIVAPGGCLVVSESNGGSLQSRVRFLLKRTFGLGRSRAVSTSAGVEYWTSTASGAVLTRQTDIRWMIHRLRQLGCTLQERHPGQFMALFADTRIRLLRRCIHAFNNAWFRHLPFSGPAIGNILIFRKVSGSSSFRANPAPAAGRDLRE